MSFFLLTNATEQITAKRQLLIFGQPQSQLVLQQLELLKKDAAGVEERDIIITLVAKENPIFKKYKMEASKRLTIILVGKDGGEKHRTYNVITAQQLFALVDAMPMRQAEMRNAKKPRH
jgi:hypothetical protein